MAYCVCMDDMRNFRLKGDPNRAVLKDHKKEGKRLIPPMMQIPKMELVSFKDNTLPCLIWISGLFVRASDREAAQKPIEFIKRCHDILGTEIAIQPLTFLNSFNSLSTDQKQAIVANSEIKIIKEFLWRNLSHQIFLFKDHPLSFLFEGLNAEISNEAAIQRLKQDVAGMLNRSSQHATKVQVTALVSMIASKRLIISPHINLPDFNSIFTDPESDEAKRAASHARASLNTDAGYMFSEGKINLWAKSFWKQAFYLDGCE